MVIETKFDIGQRVWFMYENKPKEARIFSIEPSHYFDDEGAVRQNGEHWYRLKPLDETEEMKWEIKHFPNTWREDMLFASKEDCVYSLLND